MSNMGGVMKSMSVYINIVIS